MTTSSGLADCKDDGDRPTKLVDNGVCDVMSLPELRCDEVAVGDNVAETKNGCETPCVAEEARACEKVAVRVRLGDTETVWGCKPELDGVKLAVPVKLDNAVEERVARALADGG